MECNIIHIYNQIKVALTFTGIFPRLITRNVKGKKKLWNKASPNADLLTQKPSCDS